MSFEINLNDDNGSSIDGFMQWSARGTQDGLIAPGNFYISDSGEKSTFESIKKDGVLFDIYNMKTGWNKWEGTANLWEWNENLVDWKASPGEDWKQGLQMEVSDGTQVYIWRQSGTAVMQGMSKLAKLINGNATGKLPKVKLKSAEPVKFKSGTSTNVPIFEILSWEDRPVPLVARQDMNTSGDDAEF